MFNNAVFSQKLSQVDTRRRELLEAAFRYGSKRVVLAFLRVFRVKHTLNLRYFRFYGVQRKVPDNTDDCLRP